MLEEQCQNTKHVLRAFIRIKVNLMIKKKNPPHFLFITLLINFILLLTELLILMIHQCMIRSQKQYCWKCNLQRTSLPDNFDYQKTLSRRKTESVFGLFAKFNVRKTDSLQKSISEKWILHKNQYQKNGLFTNFNMQTLKYSAFYRNSAF